MTTHNPVTEDEAATILKALQKAESDAITTHREVLIDILGKNRGQFQLDYVLAHGFLLLAELIEQGQRTAEVWMQEFREASHDGE